MGVVLGVDYGDARIGLAVTDAEKRTTLALRSIPAQPLDAALASIRDILAAEEVDKMIVGLPLTLEGKEGAQAVKTRAFADAVSERVSIPIEFVDERFSTRVAEAAARAKQTDPHAEAARVILQTWLDQHSP